MTKDSKTMSTIRRRKGKQFALALQKLREDSPKPVVASEAEVAAAEKEDDCYMFDDRVITISNSDLILFSMCFRI